MAVIKGSPFSAPLTVRLQGLWARLHQGQPKVSPARQSGASLCQVPLGLLPEAGVIKESQSHCPCKPSIWIQVRSSEGQGQPGASNLFAQNRRQPAPAGGLPGGGGAGGREAWFSLCSQASAPWRVLCLPGPPRAGFAGALGALSCHRAQHCTPTEGAAGLSRCWAGGDYSLGRGWCRFHQGPQRGHAEDVCPAPDTEQH